MATPAQDVGSRGRTWQEEAEILLSLLDCVAQGREFVYAGSELFAGQRFYGLCMEHEVRTAEELEQKLGPEYKSTLLTKNKERGMDFVRKLHELGHKTVVTPVAFNADPLNLQRNWSGAEYTSFWNLVISKKCHTVYLNEGWQFSESCVFDYLAGIKSGKKVLDHLGSVLLLPAARRMVSSAVVRLEELGFDIHKLDEAVTELKSFSSLG